MTFDVAVITPVYNTQELLHRCFKSVLNQTNVKLQYIIVDDGSTDNSGEIARQYSRIDDRVTYIPKRNEGQGIARNIGLSVAEAEFVYFVDSDDYLGENTLSALLQTARSNHLDLCSPGVPHHYFNKPLDYIACLPNKSQFMRMSILRKFRVTQPDVRSGQDGVFSHLFLTHARRIGTLRTAKYNYTHAREGSTFTTYLKKSELVPAIIERHYESIISHYDYWGLWKKNATRILEFIDQETIRNRFDPHFDSMNEAQRLQCVKTIYAAAKRAALHLSKDDLENLSPIQKTLVNAKDEPEFISQYTSALRQFEDREFAKSSNIKKGDLTICKYVNSTLVPDDVIVPRPDQRDAKIKTHSPATDGREIVAAIDRVNRKMDLSINMLVNMITKATVSLSKDIPALGKNARSDVIVSMTSLPHRLGYLENTLESLFGQTVLPRRIILWLSDVLFKTEVVADALSQFIERGLEVYYVEDVGPHTKLIYSLLNFPDDVVVTVDDDMIYPANTLQCLLEQHRAFPKAVIGNWAREIAFDKQGLVLGIRSGKLLTPPMLEHRIEENARFVGKPNILAFPYGTCGVLYPPKVLHPQAVDVGLFQKLCPKEDDLWFRAMGILADTQVVVTNLGINPIHYALVGTQDIALRHDNHGSSENIAQFRRVFEHFNLYDKIKNFRAEVSS